MVFVCLFVTKWFVRLFYAEICPFVCPFYAKICLFVRPFYTEMSLCSSVRSITKFVSQFNFQIKITQRESKSRRRRPICELRKVKKFDKRGKHHNTEGRGRTKELLHIILDFQIFRILYTHFQDTKLQILGFQNFDILEF